MITIGQRVRWIPVNPCKGTIIKVYNIGNIISFDVKWDDGQLSTGYT